MAVYCERCVAAACNHCRWFDGADAAAAGAGGCGRCRRHGIAADPLYACDDFHCRAATASRSFPAPVATGARHPVVKRAFRDPDSC